LRVIPDSDLRARQRTVVAKPTPEKSATMKMFEASPLWLLPIWALFLISLATLMLAHEVGVTLRRRVKRRASEDEDEGVGATYMAGAMSLLALLIGFSFGMSVDRYNTRRLHVTNEGNAVSATFRRLEMLDPAASADLRRTMMPYLDTRAAFSLARNDRELTLAERQSEVAEQRLWEAISRTVDPTQPPGRAVLDASIHMFDLAASRRAAMHGVIPKAIFCTLLLYASIAAAFMGFSHSQKRRQLAASSVQFVLLSMAFGLILDLDRPHTGLVRVSQTSLLHEIDRLRSEHRRLEAASGAAVR